MCLSLSQSLSVCLSLTLSFVCSYAHICKHNNHESSNWMFVEFGSVAWGVLPLEMWLTFEATQSGNWICDSDRISTKFFSFSYKIPKYKWFKGMLIWYDNSYKMCKFSGWTLFENNKTTVKCWSIKNPLNHLRLLCDECLEWMEECWHDSDMQSVGMTVTCS